MEKEKLFGTDGMRGLANQFPITADVALLIGKGLVFLLQTRYQMIRPKIVIGKDTRVSGWFLECALASGICSFGADVMLLGFIPTPAVSILTRKLGAAAGVMISASHNPYSDNGIKIFSSSGFKFSKDDEELLSDWVLNHRQTRNGPIGEDVGKVFHLEEGTQHYVQEIQSSLKSPLRLEPMKMVLDCANGASFKVAPQLFEAFGAQVIRIHSVPNGMNINEKCGAVHPQDMANTTQKWGAHLGISLDGDGDRCILSDENGGILDGDHIVGLCAIEMSRKGELKQNSVVVTPMSNIGLELSLAKHGICVFKAQVGDRHVVEKMKEVGCNLGGEQSGHIIFSDQANTGDGLLAALKVLELMKTSGKPLSELKRAIHLFPQVRVDVKISRKEPLDEHKEIANAILAAQSALKDKGRVFVRYSGTEPLARVMLEGENFDQIHFHSQNIAAYLQTHLN